MTEKGFSLIEILTVIIIIGILTAIVTPIVLTRMERAEEDAFMITLRSIVIEYEGGLLEKIYKEEDQEIKDIEITNNNIKIGTISRQDKVISVSGVGDGATAKESTFYVDSATKQDIFNGTLELKRGRDIID